MAKKESDIQTEILEWLLWRGFFVWRNNNLAAPGRKFRGLYGTPDIIGILPDGRFLGIEVKSKKGKQSVYQATFQERCEDLGGLYILAYNLKDVIEVLGESPS